MVLNCIWQWLKWVMYGVAQVGQSAPRGKASSTKSGHVGLIAGTLRVQLPSRRFSSTLGTTYYMPATSSSNPREFTCFMKLAPELRTMIWKLAIPERVIFLSPFAEFVGKAIRKHFYTDYPCNAHEARHYLTLPPLAHVCQESRRVYHEFVKNGEWVPAVDNSRRIRWKFHHPDRTQELVRKGKPKSGQTYFNPANDILCLDLWGDSRRKDDRTVWKGHEINASQNN